MTAVWLLDVDGVINMITSAPTPQEGKATTDGRTFRIKWNPVVTEFIASMSERVEIRWSTTWVDDAQELEKLFGLPAFKRAFTLNKDYYGTDRYKHDAAWDVVSEGRPLIWTDDAAIPYGAEDALRERGAKHILIIRPDEWDGLTEDHLAEIEGFVNSLEVESLDNLEEVR